MFFLKPIIFDRANNQADLSLCQVHKSVIGFVMLRLKYIKTKNKNKNKINQITHVAA